MGRSGLHEVGTGKLGVWHATTSTTRRIYPMGESAHIALTQVLEELDCRTLLPHRWITLGVKTRQYCDDIALDQIKDAVRKAAQ